MAKAKKRTSKKSAASRTTGVAKKPEEKRKIRNQVTNVILNNSVGMAQRVVRLVNEEGNINSLKFLWETARLFPTGDVEEEPDGGETLAKILLKALGLPTEPPSEDGEEREEANQEADVESEELEDVELASEFEN